MVYLDMRNQKNCFFKQISCTPQPSCFWLKLLKFYILYWYVSFSLLPSLYVLYKKQTKENILFWSFSFFNQHFDKRSQNQTALRSQIMERTRENFVIPKLKLKISFFTRPVFFLFYFFL